MCVDVGKEDKESQQDVVKQKNEQERKKKSDANSKPKTYFGRSSVWSLLLFIIFTVGISENVRQVNTSQEGDKLVNRLNYGVIFDYIGTTKPTTSILRHTFKVVLPMRKDAEEKELMEKLDILSHTRNPCLQ